MCRNIWIKSIAGGETITIEEILALEEGQTFDRKSIRIDAKTLAEPLCAFANADGGIIAIGITNSKRQIEGVDGDISKLNDLLRVPLDYCNPTVEVRTEMVPCRDLRRSPFSRQEKHKDSISFRNIA